MALKVGRVRIIYILRIYIPWHVSIELTNNGENYYRGAWPDSAQLGWTPISIKITWNHGQGEKNQTLFHVMCITYFPVKDIFRMFFALFSFQKTEHLTHAYIQFAGKSSKYFQKLYNRSNMLLFGISWKSEFFFVMVRDFLSLSRILFFEVTAILCNFL